MRYVRDFLEELRTAAEQELAAGINRAQKLGERRAWQALDEYYRWRLIGFARRKFECPLADAEDVAQHCLVGWYRSFSGSPHKWPPDRCISSWMWKTAINAGIDLLRSRQGIVYSSDSPSDAGPPTPDTACPAEGILVGGVVRDCLSRLPVERREILLMDLVEELSQREIARLEGMTRGTVANRIAEARKVLVGCLEGRYGWVGWDRPAEGAAR